MATGRLTTDDLGSRRPDPDPTIRTNEALQREVFMLRELFDSKFAGYDKAIALLQSYADRVPPISVIEERVVSQTRLTDEKFRSIATQFSERDTRTEQTSRDSKVAVDAALQAAKEAVAEQNKSSALAIAKSEAATAKQIDQLGVAFGATTSGITDKIDDIKDRISAIERGGSNVEGRSTGRHDMWAWFIGGAGAAGALAALVTLIATRA